ncbi:triose-phosphate isomerase [Frondihabitans peucedani]|uniref:Triosephosphate isomerase n=1 Tax=Frondihabitans peucedani TaxID=598626 RepID=A0ABP8E0H8_9MICO
MTVVGVSLKMYFGHARTTAWCRAVRRIADEHEAVTDGRASLFVLPTFVSIPAALEILSPVVAVGAQDLATRDSGAYTGEVSGAELAELGCTLAEVGHAERKRLQGETPETVGAKTAAALRNGLTPLLCVGEPEQGSPDAAVRACVDQLEAALRPADEAGLGGAVTLAYEPEWAIGRREPAPPSFVRDVARGLREHLDSLPGRAGSRIVYGGSAGPGLLTELGSAVDGLFLGRFAHDPTALRSILDEVNKLWRT